MGEPPAYDVWVEFEWDPQKAASTLTKHGLSFEEVSTAFGGRLAVVVHIEREGKLRIIRARIATKNDRVPMKKSSEVQVGMRDEYDFSGGVRGKYAERFAHGSNVVVLDPDVASEFGTREAVNRALREEIERRHGKASGARS